MSSLWPVHLSDEARRTGLWVGEQRPADGHHAAVAEAVARGLEEGRRSVEAELASEREALLRLAGSIEALEAPSPGLLATMMVAAVERLVSDIAGTVPIDPELLQRRAAALAATISGACSVELAAHPDDVGYLDTQRLGVDVIADPSLAPGTVQARTGEPIGEDGVSTALARMRREFERMGISL